MSRIIRMLFGWIPRTAQFVLHSAAIAVLKSDAAQSRRRADQAERLIAEVRREHESEVQSLRSDHELTTRQLRRILSERVDILESQLRVAQVEIESLTKVIARDRERIDSEGAAYSRVNAENTYRAERSHVNS